MNRSDARLIAQTITDDQIRTMFRNAKERISDWKSSSVVNKTISKGVVWNILVRVSSLNSQLAKINAIREFGEFLPTPVLMQLLPKKTKAKVEMIHHQEPDFTLLDQ